MASGGEGKKETDPDHSPDLLCSPCKRQNRSVNAEKYCADCHDYYCTECVNVHNNFPAMSGHKFLEKGQVKSLTGKDIPIVPTERCERHSFKVVDMYCQNHDDVGCYTCMAVEHRSCQDVLYIPEYVQETKSATKTEEVIKLLQEIAEDLKDKLEEYKRESKRLMQRKVEEVEKIKAFRVKINLKLDELEKKSIAEIEDEYKFLIKKIDDDIGALSTSQTDVSSSHDDITSASSNPSQLFVNIKRGNLLTKKVLDFIKTKATEFSRRDIIFECHKKLQSLLAELTSLGEIIHTPALYKVNEKKAYNIKHKSDTKECNIYSACILPGGNLILADYSNNKLKRLDGSTYIIDDTCDLKICPWQMSVVEKNEVAISSGDQIIQFVATEGKMKVTREMNFDHKCYGIAYRKGNIYVTDSRTTVYIYNMDGTRLHQFSKDQSGQALFSSIYSLTVIDNDDEKIYVADSTHGLVVLCKDGKLRGKYTCPELKWAREICVMRDRNVLVCGRTSNNIIQFAPVGTVVGEVLSSDGGNGGCLAVCFDRRHSRLIVGREKRDEIEVYNIV